MADVPLADLKAQYSRIKPEIDAAIQRVLDHAGFILGREVLDFETKYAESLGTPTAVGTASGTAALWLSLWASGVGPGDEVITAAHTFMATAEAISILGATPVFVDIDPVTFTIAPVAVETAITSRTKAIVPVHLYGHPADMDPLLELGKKRGLKVIEDAAQAHGAIYKDRRCGSIGDLACFSFFPGKNLGAYGDAGAVTGKDQALLTRIRKLRDHGRISKYEHDEIGFGERLDALQAAILTVKLAHLEAWTLARRSIAQRYRQTLETLPITLPSETSHARHVYHLFVIRLKEREALLSHLKQKGVSAGVHYPIPLHRQPAYLKLGYGKTSLPETERAAAEVLSLPIFPEMSEQQISSVIEGVRSFFS